jgi:hypothetical protein
LKRPRGFERADLIKAIRRDLHEHVEDSRNERGPDYEARAQQLGQIVCSSTPGSPLRIGWMPPAMDQGLVRRILSKISSIGAKWKLSFSRNMSL